MLTGIDQFAQNLRNRTPYYNSNAPVRNPGQTITQGNTYRNEAGEAFDPAAAGRGNTMTLAELMGQNTYRNEAGEVFDPGEAGRTNTMTLSELMGQNTYRNEAGEQINPYGNQINSSGNREAIGPPGTNPNLPSTAQGPYGYEAGMEYLFNPINIEEDPSYKFRFDEGKRAVEAAAAAKGTLGSGATLRELTRYGQGLASTEYQNAFNRKHQNIQSALGITGMTENLRQGEFGRGVTLENLSEMLRQGQFNRQYSLADMGLRAQQSMLGGSNPSIPGSQGYANAPSAGPYGSQANFNYGGYQQGMSNAAGHYGNAGMYLGQGTAAQGNIWQNVFGQLGEIGGNYWGQR